MQAILAYRALAPTEPADRFRFGIMASSDTHTARAGSGYKEVERLQMTDARMSRISLPGAVTEPPAAESQPVVPWSRPPTDWMERERLGSFFYTGGLVAVHASARSREAIWQALERRAVYGTSGPRILLWFDILNPGGDAASPAPMGSETRMGEAPAFRVRAVGSLEQQPGCPEHSLRGLTGERLERLCSGECHNPSDQRRLVTRIEVIRIRPQILPGEPLEPLIEDPWRVFTCPADPAGCSVEFSDETFDVQARDTVYYVRAIEAPAPAINAGTLRCERRRRRALHRLRSVLGHGRHGRLPCAQRGARVVLADLRRPRVPARSGRTARGARGAGRDLVEGHEGRDMGSSLRARTSVSPARVTLRAYPGASLPERRVRDRG